MGDTVEHGSFEGLDVEWLTLSIDKENEKALLVTKDIVAYRVFNAETQEEVTWKTSDIREWLNTTFYNSAFTDEQKVYILESEITNPANPLTDIDGGANTVDKVFLLSYDEALQYFSTEKDRVAYCNFTAGYAANLAKMIGATPQLNERGEDVLAELQSYMGTTDSWWLRTSGNSLLDVAGVSYSGELEKNRNKAWSLQGIRPAIWVNLCV